MTHRRALVTLAALSTMLVASGSRAQPIETPQLRPVRRVQDLRQLRPDTPDVVAIVAGFHAPGDGGGGLFVWRAELTDKPDGGTVIGPVSGDSPGRWCRVHDGPLNVRMFGAIGDGKTDDTAAIQAAMDAAAGAELRIPAGTWLITRTLHFKSVADRHSTGLKLAGDGMMATVLDCRIDDGPALSIEQAKSYVFGKGGWIRDIEFLGIHAKPGREQHCIVMSGAWLYRLERLTIRSFRGHGILVPFMTNRGFVYSDIDIIAGSDIARQPKGELVHTILSGETIVGDGIAPGTLVERVIDDRTLRMTKPALRDGRVALNIFGRNPDGQQTLLFMRDCRVIWNHGWGIYGDINVGFSLTLRDCEIGVNRTGGIRTDGLLDIYGGSVGVNGTNDGKGIGILLDAATNSGAHRARIEAVEIDGNKEVNLWLRRARFVQVARCRFNAAEWDKLGVQFPPVSIRLGDKDGSTVQTAEFVQNMLRVDGRHLLPQVGFEIPDGAAVDNLRVRDTLFWGGWSDAHHTKYRIGKLANEEAQIRFDEEGRLSAGMPVPASYCTQLRTKGTARKAVAPGAVHVIQFAAVQSNQPRLPANWPMARVEKVSTSEGSNELRSAAVANLHLAPGMPVLLPVEVGSLEDLASAQIGKVASASVEKGLVILDRAAAQSMASAALIGGTILPYKGYFAIDAVIDLLGAGKAQPITVALLADAKPWRVENSLIHGLAVEETVRLLVTGQWAAGTAFHVALCNTSPAAMSLVRATLTLRLLT